MKERQNDLPVPHTDEEGGSEQEAALGWELCSRSGSVCLMCPGHAAPGSARQPGLGISGLLSVLVKSFSF